MTSTCSGLTVDKCIRGSPVLNHSVYRGAMEVLSKSAASLSPFFLFCVPGLEHGLPGRSGAMVVVAIDWLQCAGWKDGAQCVPAGDTDERTEGIVIEGLVHRRPGRCRCARCAGRPCSLRTTQLGRFFRPDLTLLSESLRVPLFTATTASCRLSRRLRDLSVLWATMNLWHLHHRHRGVPVRSTSRLPSPVLFRVVLPSSTASCSRCPRITQFSRRPLHPPRAATPQSPGQGRSRESTSVPCRVVRTSRRETISISISCSSKRRNLRDRRCA